MSAAMSRPEATALAPVFAALGDPTRAAILDRLSREGRLTLTDLSRGAPISRQAVSRHVAVLADAGLVTGAREGRELRLSLRPEALVVAASWLAQVSAAWDGALDRLKRQVEEETD
jgi:DNA-binding transcriptional ArsR family regulator